MASRPSSWPRGPPHHAGWRDVRATGARRIRAPHHDQPGLENRERRSSLVLARCLRRDPVGTAGRKRLIREEEPHGDRLLVDLAAEGTPESCP